MDSTTLIRCINCNIKFRPKSVHNIFHSYKCQEEYMGKVNQIKKYVRVEQIEKEAQTQLWKKNNLGRMMKYYEVFGKKYNCDICGLSFEENMKLHKLPLHMFLRPGINDHQVMDENNWMRYCTRCYANIQFMKQEDNNDK